MEAKLQHQIAFYLTGRRSGDDLLPMDGQHRPALFARFTDLSELRYDFPLVLNQGVSPDRAVLSLAGLIDDAIEALAQSPECGRVARHGYRLEREVKRDLAAGGESDLETLWNSAAERLAASDGLIKDSAQILWNDFFAKGELLDVGIDLPARTVKHAWISIQAKKAQAFRQTAERLLLKLHDILAAETAGSRAGRSPEMLRAGIGSAFVETFDFDAFSNLLIDAKPAFMLSDKRRNRIRSLIDVLESQRFFPLGNRTTYAYEFSFLSCSDALDAYNSRRTDAVELAKSLAVAELETTGEYREEVHDVIFESFGANGLDHSDLAQLPDYLICTDAKSLDPAETAQILELLAAGLPFKILVQTDDVLEPSSAAEGHAALGIRSRQLVQTAIGLTDVFVYQASASQSVRKYGSLLSGLTYDGPALFSMFTGANQYTSEFPAYLVAAAATESRVFPSLVYNPSAGSDWASRLSVDDNPRSDDDWPVHTLKSETGSLQAMSEDIAFTLADLMAMDNRFFGHFSLLPETAGDDGLTPVAEALKYPVSAIPETVPYITLVNDEGSIRKAILDDRILLETRRCLTMWHSLQELGGIHNSHAERLLANDRKSRAAASQPAVSADTPVPAEAIIEAPLSDEIATTGPEVSEANGDDPYIETARCTTCNECTNVNNKMFAYDENKQAFIADPDAGTYRQLVEAAEGCQVSIIHPGKPRNPKEPGLEDLIRRAADFN